MRKLDYDPLTKMWVSFAYNEATDDITIGHHQDIENVLEYNKTLAKIDDYSKRGIHESWWHYAKVPNSVIMKMKADKGVDFFDKDHAKAVFAYLNDPENQYLKTTTKHHAPK